MIIYVLKKEYKDDKDGDDENGKASNIFNPKQRKSIILFKRDRNHNYLKT